MGSRPTPRPPHHPGPIPPAVPWHCHMPAKPGIAHPWTTATMAQTHSIACPRPHSLSTPQSIIAHGILLFSYQPTIIVAGIQLWCGTPLFSSPSGDINAKEHDHCEETHTTHQVTTDRLAKLQHSQNTAHPQALKCLQNQYKWLSLGIFIGILIQSTASIAISSVADCCTTPSPSSTAPHHPLLRDVPTSCLASCCACCAQPQHHAHITCYLTPRHQHSSSTPTPHLVAFFYIVMPHTQHSHDGATRDDQPQPHLQVWLFFSYYCIEKLLSPHGPMGLCAVQLPRLCIHKD